MSDCIRKSAVSTMLMDTEWNNGTFTEAILKLNDLPTVDEKEIIRKPFERVVERLEEQKQQYKRRRTENAEKNIHHMAEINYAKACSYDYAIKIVKKECGISE